MTVTSNGEEYSVYLEYPEGTYDDASRLLGASISGIPLSELATLQYTDSQQTVMKTDGKYTLTITATCLSDDVSRVQERLDGLAEEMDFAGTVEIVQNSMDEMMIESFTALARPLQRRFSWSSWSWPCSLSHPNIRSWSCSVFLSA